MCVPWPPGALAALQGRESLDAHLGLRCVRSQSFHKRGNGSNGNRLGPEGYDGGAERRFPFRACCQLQQRGGLRRPKGKALWKPAML